MNRNILETLLGKVNVGRMVIIDHWDILDMPGGWLVTCAFIRPDRDTQKVEIGRGRGWWVAADATEEQVIRTAFSAVQMLVTHELLEFFRVGEERVFDPHERHVAHGEIIRN